MAGYLTTVGERAGLHGLSCREELALELEQPWLRSWAARHQEGLPHIRAWLAAGRPVVDRSAIDIEGGPAIAAVVRDLITILPEPVAHRLVTGRVQIRCGLEACDVVPGNAVGWVSASREPLFVGLLLPDEAVVAHELGHAWTMTPSVVFQGLDAEQKERLIVCLSTVDEASVDRYVESAMVDEFAADRLASLWLGRSVDTTSGRRGDSRRRGLRDQLRVRAALERSA